jgi:hypothetical protein
VQVRVAKGSGVQACARHVLLTWHPSLLDQDRAKPELSGFLGRCGTCVESEDLEGELIKIDAKVVNHARYIIFQMAEVAVSRELFEAILGRIGRLRMVYAGWKC